MSCHSCGSSPCSCDHECDPNNEPLSSALNNFISAFFGSVTKTCVNGEVQWILPCDLDAGVAGYPRISGEGLACYFQRVLGLIATRVQSLEAQVILSPSGYIGLPFLQPAEGGTVIIYPIGAGGLPDTTVYNLGDTIYIEGAGYYTVTNVTNTSVTIQSVYNIANAGDTITQNTNIYVSVPDEGFTGAQALVASVTWDSPNLTYVATGLAFVNGRCLGRFIPNNVTPVTILTTVSC